MAPMARKSCLENPYGGSYILANWPLWKPIGFQIGPMASKAKVQFVESAAQAARPFESTYVETTILPRDLVSAFQVREAFSGFWKCGGAGFCMAGSRFPVPGSWTPDSRIMGTGSRSFWPQVGSRWPHVGSKLASRRPRWPPEASKMPQKSIILRCLLEKRENAFQATIVTYF